MRSSCAPLSRDSSDARARRSAVSASSRFSNTLSSSYTVGFWNLRPMPICAISGSARRSRSIVEPKKALPASGRVLPVMQSIIVVLPAPLGPMMQRSSPTLMVSDSALSALKPSKLTVMSSRYSATPCAKSGSPTFSRRPNDAARPPDAVARSACFLA